MKTLGFIVNPISGMGGAVGLKGTDGVAVLKKARILGAKPVAPKKAEFFLSKLKHIKTRIRLVGGAGIMGEYEAKKCGLNLNVLGKIGKNTTAEDTKKIAKKIRDEGSDLLVFCGGDGTARDIAESINLDLPVLGVPTGVKMHSAVFAVDPFAAARITIRYLWEELPIREAEIMDVDEEIYREGRISTRIYGYSLTPYEPTLIQGVKVVSQMSDIEMYNQAAIAINIIEEMIPGVVYITGPGTTTRTIADLLNEKKTLLGVDLFLNKKLIAKDVNEKQILKEIKDKPARIIVTPIGGQGFIFGRGNLQISPKVIRQVGLNNIIVIATKHKLKTLKYLRVDTGDSDLDDKLSENIRVRIDYKQVSLRQIK